VTSRHLRIGRENVPGWARLVFLVLIATVLGLAIHGVVGLGGNGIHTYLDAWLSCGAEWVIAGLCAAGALRSERNRSAWLLVALAMVLWALGDTVWTLRGDPEASVTFSDFCWLAWYPLLIGALVLLVRDRVPVFELHRWIDGVVVMLVIITPWVALFLQPAAERAHDTTMVDVVDFAYPLGDAILVGATLGVLALMGWRAAPMWLSLVIGLSALGLADAIYSVDALGHTYSSDTVFDALWLGGLVLIAYAAWLPHPGRLPSTEVYGWKAIALPLAAQVFAVVLQIYGLFFTVPLAERVLTIAVLLIAIVQIVVSRPRSPAEEQEEAAEEAADEAAEEAAEDSLRT
jgi:hypothetical protein